MVTVKKSDTRRGYTLVELSISLTIMAIITVATANLFKNINDHDLYKITNEKIVKIEQAIKQFIELNQFIPCPAVGTSLETELGFGRSVIYNSVTHQCPGLSTNVGMVPVRTLGLSDDYAFDGWGNKFSFKIATGMGGAADFSTNGLTTSLNPRYPGDIKIIDLLGFDRTTVTGKNIGAAYVLISYGPDGRGSWNRVDSAPTLPSINSPEYQNSCHLLGVTQNQFYIQNPPTNQFSNIVVFKKLSDLLPSLQGLNPIVIPSTTCSNAALILENQAAVTDLTNIPGMPPSLPPQVLVSASTIAQLCSQQKIKLRTSKVYSQCLKTPINIQSSGLQIWLDGSDPNGTGVLPSNGSSITTWVDKSGSGYNASAVAGVNNPTFVANSVFASNKGAINFNGAQRQGLIVDLSSLNNKFYTIFIVVSWNKLYWQPLSYPLGSDVAHGNQLQIGVVNDGIRSPHISHTYGTLVPGILYGQFFQPSKMNIIVATFSSTNLGINIIDKNGYNKSSNLNVNIARSAVGQGQIGLYTSPVCSLGCIFDGSIAEIIIYNQVLDSDVINEVEGYLLRKWSSGEC